MKKILFLYMINIEKYQKKKKQNKTGLSHDRAQ